MLIVGHTTTTTEVPGGHGSFKVNATSSTHENEGQEREEAAGDEVFYNVMASIATITVLIFLSIVFEMVDTGAEWLRESTEEINMPFVNTIFNELTTLGFIGSILFLMSKSGHDLHVLVCSVLLQFGIQVQSELREFERRAPYVQVVVADYCLSTEPATSWWDKLNWRRWQEIAKSKREMVYVSLRRRFVDYHSNHPDPAKAKELAKDFQLEKDTRFPFNEYLTIISGEVMARLIQIDAITWVALEICIVALICLCWWVGPDNEVFVLLGGGAVLIGLNQIVYRRISTMRTLLTPPLLFKKAERYRTKPAWRAQHGLPLLPSSPLMSDEKEKLATDNTPPYLLKLPLGGIDLTSQELADRQKALLGGGNGVLLALFSTRLVFLFTALHLSVFLMRTSGQLIRRHDLHAVEKAVIFVLLALPSLIVASVSTMIARVMRILKARQTLRTLRFVAEMKVYLREHHATEGKAASMKNPPKNPPSSLDPADDLRRRSLSFNDTATLPTHHRPSQLLHGATSLPGTGDKLSLLSPRSRSNVEEPMSPMSEPSSRSKAPGRRAKYDEETERREINSIFCLFDRDQYELACLSGAITRDEMESLLHVISPDMTESQISRIIVVLDEHHTGEVTFDEFYRWCRSHIHRELVYQIDRNSDGKIDFEEFEKMLHKHAV
ncbi:hypothetical protein DYB38_009532 [Aphanomyces astaci]|uniref:EF-hand domain-containing protein n=1 Tax=Aphanomyces astaci TaxID=112090 RepID=A0A397AEB4_APHAT|nr:hypothetical protein DYB36_008144 [Aphanomyces astaci]RHY51039.1 hypothetical protein DYB38_009532 [Aphanomyces astaci]